jgi:DNA-binding CsgD family transcriptional regulator
VCRQAPDWQKSQYRDLAGNRYFDLGRLPHAVGAVVREYQLMRLIHRPTSRPARKRSNSLTSREIEVLTWVARGKSAWEIGEILHITKRTVDEHVRAATRKLGAVNRTQAVALAIRDRIIDI